MNTLELVVAVLVIGSVSAEVPDICNTTAHQIIQKFVRHPEYRTFYGLKHNSTVSVDGGHLIVEKQFLGIRINNSVNVIDGYYANKNVFITMEVTGGVAQIFSIMTGTYKGRNVNFRAGGHANGKLRFLVTLKYNEKMDSVELKSVKVFNMRQWKLQDTSCRLNTERCRTFNALLLRTFAEMEAPVANTFQKILDDVKLRD
jgi:phage regulator Rha-like protein